MTSTHGDGKLWRVYEELRAGRISRREFIERAVALGVSLSVATFVVNSIGMNGASAAPAPGAAALRGAAQSTPAGRPTAGTEGLQRGAGGELKILQWQGITTLSLHTATGTKDQLGASLVTEGLLSFLPDGTLIPNLAKEVPSKENGGLSEDLKTVTYHLLDGVKWSDGEPFTADDVVFTYDWIMNPDNGANTKSTYEPIEKIEAVDPLTVKITLKEGTLAWYNPFSGTYWGAVYPKHILSAGKDAHDQFRQNPVGTGPYKVESFKENDQVIFVINDNYREATKPYFAKINVKGGGDAVSAARAVLETGDWQVAWNLQVEPKILADMEGKGKGRVLITPGTSVERLNLNFSDPNKEVDGQRSEMHTPHPYLTDKAVREALNLAVDRQTISTQFYQGPPGEPPTANILVGIPAFESKNTSFEFNLDKANQVLDQAGWTKNGDVREKNGVQLKMDYATTINAVRQKTQAVNKKNFEAIGFKVNLKQVDAGIFFDSSEGNEQNFQHFYVDVHMYTNNASTPFPQAYMASWYGGKDGSNIAQKSNGWSGLNESRWQNAEFDAMWESLSAETDPEKAAETFIKMNDLLISEVVLIPEVQRAAEAIALANNISDANIAASPWETLYWNMANWTAAQG